MKNKLQKSQIITLLQRYGSLCDKIAAKRTAHGKDDWNAVDPADITACKECFDLLVEAIGDRQNL